MKNLFIRIRWIAEKTKSNFHRMAFIILLGAASSILGVYRAIATKWLVDAATVTHIDRMYEVLLILALMIVGDIALKSIATFMAAKSSLRISNRIQQKLYSKIIKTRWMDFSKYHSGDYLTRMTSDVDAITYMVVNTVPNIIAVSVLMVGSFIAIFKIDIFLALLISAVFPVSALIARFYSSRIKKIYLKSQQIESKYRSFLNESIQNILIVKSFCLENMNIEKIRSLQKDRFKLNMSRTKISIISNSAMSAGTWVGFFVVFLWGSLKLSSGATTFGTLMALIQLIGNIQAPFSALAASLPQVVYSVASAERLMEIENLPPDIEGAEVKDMKSAGIVFEDVNFSYKEGVPVLSNVSININPGEVIGIVGPSGEGKTTFIHMVLSLLSPESGHIYTYDDYNKVELSAKTRNLISYVPQGNNLFSGTIADNLRFGAPTASDSDLELAAKAACAWEFIANSPDGLNTLVGERGMGLSEGQAQRIAIARALLHKTPILLLDEATSALDSKTEVEVLKSIKDLSPKPTCIIITHRPSALEICNKVFRIEGNILKEQAAS